MLFYVSYLKTPIGSLEINADEQKIHSIIFKDNIPTIIDFIENEISKLGYKQLEEYFNNKRTIFDLPLYLSGTDFQNKVWTELQQILFGKTISYLQLAKNLGDVKCIRAAGTANGKNPFAIVVPCHRVIGKDGSLTGYAGGLWRKQWLLEHEGALRKQTNLF